MLKLGVRVRARARARVRARVKDDYGTKRHGYENAGGTIKVEHKTHKTQTK